MTTIKAEAGRGLEVQSFPTEWSHCPHDPLAIEVVFPEQEVVWDFSLELFQSAFSALGNGIHGEGDVQIEIFEEFAFVLLWGEDGNSASLKFSADEIREFLDQIDDHGHDEIIAREIEEWLETL
ncbi:SsgA family sporulation/cell division regulator [Streptomyces globisporus]|uniref:SsgA family sporulation/cell division regulator n=1 Tax=Streptomyces globisporus TaxID=1908 RepID=UPI0036742777